jgi:hypothetical protein
VSAFKVEQRRIMHRGCQFHFVSYDAVPPNERKGEPGEAPHWYLMLEGKRHQVAPVKKDQDPEDLDRELIRWLSREIFDPMDAEQHARLH